MAAMIDLSKMPARFSGCIRRRVVPSVSEDLALRECHWLLYCPVRNFNRIPPRDRRCIGGGTPPSAPMGRFLPRLSHRSSLDRWLPLLSELTCASPFARE